MAMPNNSEIVSLKPSFALFLWDGFTGASNLAGAVDVRIGGKKPLFHDEGSRFVFTNLANGKYLVTVQSAPEEPYYLPVDIPVAVPFPRPTETLWNPTPVWSAYPDIVLADPNEMLDDPDQTVAYLGQRALATLRPSTGYPFPAGTTLVRGVVSAKGKALSGALVTTSPLGQPGQSPIVVANRSGSVSETHTLSIVQGPLLDGVDPAAAIAGSDDITLLIEGNGFMPGAVVQWDGAAVPTDFLTSGALTAQIGKSLMRASGATRILAVNPNGKASNSLTFVVAAAPVITSVNPPTVTAGGPALNLEVIGSGFAPGAQVLLAGAPIPTKFAGSTQLNARVSADRIQSTSLVSVLVMNPGEPRQSSNAKALSVVNQPVINSLEPSAVVAGSEAFDLIVSGSGFRPGATVQVAGADHPTQVLSTDKATAHIAANQVASAGQLSLSVSNPDGTVSKAQQLTILAAPAITALDPEMIATGDTAFSVAVRGRGYASDSVVELNGVPLSTTFVDSTELRAHVPRSGYRTEGDGTFVLFFDSLKGPRETIALIVSHPDYSNVKSVNVDVRRGATASIHIDMSSQK